MSNVRSRPATQCNLEEASSSLRFALLRQANASPDTSDVAAKFSFAGVGSWRHSRCCCSRESLAPIALQGGAAPYSQALGCGIYSALRHRRICRSVLRGKNCGAEGRKLARVRLRLVARASPWPRAKAQCLAGRSTKTERCRNLTPPSSGRPKGRCAPFAPPLMSNVRPGRGKG